VSNTVLRDVSPNARTISTGQAVNLLGWTATSSLIMRTSLVERSVAAGVFVGSAGTDAGGQGEGDARLERIWVRDVATAADGRFGIGINAQGSFDGTTVSTLTVVDSLVENTVTAGVIALDTELTLSDSEIRSVAVDGAGDFGDAVIAIHYFQPATVPLPTSIARVLSRDAERAGLANFGLVAQVEDVWIDCSAFPLNGEQSSSGVPFEFSFGGDTRCTCSDVQQACRVLSSGLRAPDPLQ